MMEESEPVANENEITPMIMIRIASSLSNNLTEWKSPNPTVVIV
jgi:hypothetical protein